MKKLWYPVAISVTVASCGAEVDAGHPSPGGGGTTSVDAGVPAHTGGRSPGYYGVQWPTGGSLSTDSGTPAQTGGMTPMPPYGAIPSFGGTPSTNAVIGGGAAMGGTTSIDAGTPRATGGRIVVIIYGAIGVYSLRSL
jgi:hypothetical protein